MKALSPSEMRTVAGGRWQCNFCKKKFNTWISLFNNDHCGCGYTEYKAKYKKEPPLKDCVVPWGYHWVF